MATKQKAISLHSFEQLNPDVPGQMRRVWRVARVVNSIEYAPDQMLDRNVVDSLCQAKDWTVAITSV